MSLIGSVSLTDKTGVYLGQVNLNNFDASANNLIYTTDGTSLSGLTVGSGLTVASNTLSATAPSVTGLIKYYSVVSANHSYSAGPTIDLQVVPPLSCIGLTVGNLVIIDTAFTFYSTVAGIIMHIDLYNSTGFLSGQTLQCSIEAADTHLTKSAKFAFPAPLANDSYSIHISTDGSYSLQFDYNDYFSMQINQVQ